MYVQTNFAVIFFPPDLSADARILFCSNSIIDILGYHPSEILGRSCFDYFHPDEVPFARSVHGRGVELDKAAVLFYARIRNCALEWVGCECVFTIVHNVLVASTSIYRLGIKSESKQCLVPSTCTILNFDSRTSS